MKTFFILINRNVKLYFRDKGAFISSLITPIILLVLYATFLADVYRNIYLAEIPEGVEVAKSVVDGLVGGQLISSILAVSCVSVAFCSNFVMINDRALGIRRDFEVSPVKKSTLALSYFLAVMINTLTVCLFALAVGFVYLAAVGWYLTASDVILAVVDVIILVMFGTALSSVVNFFLTTQGQASAVLTIVSAGYGFICGAYMPVSQFGTGLRNALAFLPGTYGTGLLRNHFLSSALVKLTESFPEGLEGFRDAVDCNIYFFGYGVSVPAMYAVLVSATAAVAAAYVLINVFAGRKNA